MKKVLALFLAAAFCFTVISLLAVAGDDVIVGDMEDYSGPMIGTMFQKATGSRHSGNSSIYINKDTGGAYDDATYNGTRRTKLMKLSKTATAGEYTVSVWVYDRANTLTKEGAKMAALISFHNSSTTDDSLAYNYATDTAGLVKVFDTLTEHASDDAFENATVSKCTLSLSGKSEKGVDGTSIWKEYTGTVTLTEDASQFAVWYYKWNGSSGEYANIATSDFIFFDDMTLTAVPEETTSEEETTADEETTTAELEPEDKVYTCSFESAAGWESGMLGKASGYKFDGSASLFMNARLNSLGDDTTKVNDTCGISNGTRRSKLHAISETVPAGKYKMSIYVAENAQILENGNIGIIITFHDKDVTDTALKLQWNDASLNECVVMAVNTFDGDENELSGTLHFTGYTGNKVKLTKGSTATGVDGNVWTEYTGTVELTGDATQVAAWLYLWAGYNTSAPATEGQNIYVDGLTLTPIEEEETSESDETTAPEETVTEEETTTVEETTIEDDTTIAEDTTADEETTEAEETTAKPSNFKKVVCDFDEGVKAYKGTTFIGAASATYFTDAKSAFFKPVSFGVGVTGALGDLTSGGDQPATRRTQLVDIGSTIPAGTYDITIMVADPVGIIDNKDSDFGMLVTLHEGSLTDDELAGKWYDDSVSVSTIKIFDNHGKAVKGDDYIEYTMKKAGTSTGADGKVWTRYKVTITISKAVDKCALWIYQPGGELGDYDNQYQKADGMQIYIDDLTFSAPGADTGDFMPIIALIALVCGITVTAVVKKKHC